VAFVQVAADMLDALLDAAQAESASFEVRSYERQACSILQSSEMYENCKLVTFFKAPRCFGEWILREGASGVERRLAQL
jgi:hypothetical protein